MDFNRSMTITCGHCGYKGLMKSLARYSERDIETIKSPCGYLVKDIMQPWGIAYELLQCISCNEVTLLKIDWHDEHQPEDYNFTILYPNLEYIQPDFRKK